LQRKERKKKSDYWGSIGDWNTWKGGGKKDLPFCGEEKSWEFIGVANK